MIIDISSDFEKEEIEETHVEFLEWLKRAYPEIFEFDFPWYCRNLLYHYIDEGKHQKVADIITPFFQAPERDVDVLADILDVLRMNGFPILTGELVRAAYPRVKANSDIVSWGLAELSQLCGISIISKHITIGGGIQPKAIGKLKDDLSEPQEPRKFLAKRHSQSPKSHSERKRGIFLILYATLIVTKILTLYVPMPLEILAIVT